MAGRRTVLALALAALAAGVATGYWSQYRFPPEQAREVMYAIEQARQDAPGLMADIGYDGCHPLRLGCGEPSATMTLGLRWPDQLQVAPQDALVGAQQGLPDTVGRIRVEQAGPVVRDPGTGWASFPFAAAFPDGTTAAGDCGILTDQAADPDAASRLAAERAGLPDGVACRLTVAR